MPDLTPDERQLRDDALAELATSRPGAPSGPAVRALVDHLLPVIRHRITRVLLTYGRGRALGELRGTVDELTQMVFGKLFENEAHVLRIWDGERGMSLRNWAGRFAGLRTKDVVQSGRRDPFRHEATPSDHMERIAGATAPSDDAEVRQLWSRLTDCVLGDQTDKGRTLFGLIYEDDCSTAEIVSSTGMTAEAIYQWRRRLKKAFQRCWGLHSA